MRKIAFEGVSFSGKTTLASSLERESPEEIKMLAEYVVYAGGGQNFPPFPPKNKQEAIKSLEFFLNLERRRHKDIEALKDRPYFLVLDRSIVSLLGFRFAQKYLHGIDIFEETRQILGQEPQLAPDFVFYLDVNDKETARRLAVSQRPVGDLFIDPEFNRRLRQFFDWLKENRDYPLITIHADRPIEDVKKDIRKILDNIKDGKVVL